MDLDQLFAKLTAYQRRGYYLNPDVEFTRALLESLLVNEERYGYQACPCRLAANNRAEDLDIICPCDYRDADTTEYGACFCGLYVSKKIYTEKGAIQSIPERRPPKDVRDKIRAGQLAKEKNIMTDKNKPADSPAGASGAECCDLDYPVWRCDVCGYICARDDAPDICPICGVTKDRFHIFM
ncbi:MAG: ferredoxin-thioredoxin reductase catalytic domain-containing protein [Actinomycetota bacterium]